MYVGEGAQQKDEDVMCASAVVMDQCTGIGVAQCSIVGINFIMCIHIVQVCHSQCHYK